MRHSTTPVILSLLLAACSTADQPETSLAATLPLAVVAPCDSTGLSNATLAPMPPCVVAFSDPAPAGPSVAQLQPYFDAYSWKTFIGVSWPVKAGTTEPDPAVMIGSVDAPTVWESWKGAWEIFLADGGTPAPWGTRGTLPEPCGTVPGAASAHVLPFVGKTPEVLTDFDQPFLTGPLIDQAGNYTRYEILVNEPMFDYIVANQLYNIEGQEAFDRDSDFPADSSNAQPSLQGAMMVKAAWRRITEAERGSFHVREALVYTPPSEDPAVAASCTRALMGLVGFHIAHKTTGEPQWLWSTFEHVRNAPSADALPVTGSWNYYDPACTDCAINEPPARPWNPNNEPDMTRRAQVVRSIAIPEDARALTDTFHNSLRAVNPSSVWLNYQLISTQWPTVQTPTDPSGDPAPTYLANTTLETYIQGTVPNVSSNCILCHNNAADTQGRFSDFTYLLQLAKKRVTP